ncbi:hypothetical protein L486_01654 [Kwoniella mangroviensis CBS 10435]|uniref:Beta-galactosidase domain-containing protein n=1 Tax=Kwoniella mangroviensis CBS 10435 TaxID=1331196 RepID=A0A1B9J2H2_9TREE|nr:hypothetical protein L486_01654 [Kwoniella mangroviensis CBS 10435]
MSVLEVRITSYDYWLPISEDRSLKDKYYELKSISHFVRSSRDLPKTYPVSTLDYGTLHVGRLVNPDTQGTFYVAGHIDSTSREKSRHSLTVRDEVGKVDLPVYLNERDSRILSSNYCWGKTCILHTSASIFTSTTIGNTDILVLYAPQDEGHRLAFPLHQHLSIAADTVCNVKEEIDKERKVIKFQVGQGTRDLVSVVGGRRKVEVILLDSKEVSWAWEAVVEPGNEESFGAFYSFGHNERVLVLGPLILRGEFRDVDEMMKQLNPRERKGLALKVSLISGPGGVGAFWLNGVYLGTGIADIETAQQEVNLTLRIPHNVIRQGRKNVITIVIDPAPLEEAGAYTGTTESISAPRGIRGYSLLGRDTSAIEWKIQGNTGGWEQYPDKVRGVFNVGGLYGERKGWNLPGYDDGRWENEHFDGKHLVTVTADLDEVQDSGAGIGWWRGRIEVEYPDGLDLHYSFVFPRILSPVRGQLFVNGWQLGRFYGDLGPQYRFPIPPGILAQGNNTVAISLFGYDKSADPKKFIEGLVMEVDEFVTTTSLKLREMKVESPSWEEVFRSGA